MTIPTYEVGKPEKNPMFLEKRVYQGSSGVVYPYPVIESISDKKVDRDWHAVWLENEYIKVMILPELGGRVQMAYDKIGQRHFVYYNHVVKPSLVGLTGPWISGGIEFNWPQHHRPSTFLPIDATIVENGDGSVTVWVNEMERMTHQKGMAGLTLRPGCAYLEVQGRVSNRSPLPQSFLWWANPAVQVNEAYQSVFPPDVNAVFDHGRRDVSSFPIATGVYYKMDYSAGVDISRYRNIPVPTSFMAAGSRYDFEGGYENDSRGGMLHVASHLISPGKKQWTWGCGDFGRAWDRNLTDEATPEEKARWGIEGEGFRPYIELMAGVYTENQPDFAWLMPYEEKQFVQYFMPYREIGIVRQASRDFIVGIEEVEEGVCFRVLATSRRTVGIVLRDGRGGVLYDRMHTLGPEAVLTETVRCPGVPLSELSLSVGDLCWRAEPDGIRPLPEAARAALPPCDTRTTDELYLTGLHLEQYRHATWSALDYYEEALRRDPRDVRCLTQTGLWYLRRGRFERAAGYLRRAVGVWHGRNPNPYDGEAVFYLALALKFLGRPDEAYELFWKSAWNRGWADAGYYQAACISMSEGRYCDALDELERCLIHNSRNHQARALKAVALRKTGRREQALAWIRTSYEVDHFNYVCMMEEHLLTDSAEPIERLRTLMRDSSDNYDEAALEYCAAGLYAEARAVWDIAMGQGATSPMTFYYQGRYAEGEQADSAYCFPNRLEAILALEGAKGRNPSGAKAPYYLGCLYYDKRQYDLAIENWELSARLDPAFPTVWRNLALARFNKQGRRDEALEYMERAFSLDRSDARVLMELDQLYKCLHRPCEERLAFLQEYSLLILQRDALVLEEITLLNSIGQYEEAMRKLDHHTFHPWEGGEGKVPAQYQICRVELAKRAIVAKDYGRAIRLLTECLEYPSHLGEGKLYGAQDNDFYYLLGMAYDALGQKERAIGYWKEATKGPQQPAAAMYYNDAKPDKILFQGLALRRLGLIDEARGRFYKLINFGKQHIFDRVVMDYFAVSLPDLLVWEESLEMKNRIHCLYMLALGYYGLDNRDEVLKYISEVKTIDNNHQGVQQLLSLMDMEVNCH